MCKRNQKRSLQAALALEKEMEKEAERGGREGIKYILVFMCIATSQRKPLQSIETQQRSTAETLAGAVLADGR